MAKPRQRYRLLRDTPELRAGAIVEEQCDNGDQGYICISPSDRFDDSTDVIYTRKVVMENPKYFEEVFSLQDFNLNRKEVDALMKLLRK